LTHWSNTPHRCLNSLENNDKRPSDNLEDKDTTHLLKAIILEALSHQASTFTQPRLSSLIQSALNNNRIILLIDGMDELPPERVHQVGKFIQAIMIQYPKIRIVASVAFENMGLLPSLGFQVMAMAAWGDLEKVEFVHKWGKLWKKVLLTAEQDPMSGEMHHYLDSWLTVHTIPCTPFEFTLKVWSAFSGDTLGSDGRSAIEAYVRRMTCHQSKSRAALEQLALQMVISMNFALQPQRGDTTPLNPADQVSEMPSDNHDDTFAVKKQRGKIPLPAGDLANTGLFQSHSDMRLRFLSPIITGYLAGHALLTYTGLTQIQEQPAWIGKTLSLFFFSYFGDASSIIQYLLKHDDFLRHEQLNIGRWLMISTKSKPWRTLVMRTLVTALHAEQETSSLAARIIIAIALSGDPGVSVLLRQMLHSDNPILRQLAALACGIYADPKVVDDLSQLLNDKLPPVVRSASLALVAIGDKHALEIVADSLLRGNEFMRRAAAEALANHPSEGYPALEEGSKVDDLRVRYSVVYGLMRVQQPWAIKIIERMQLEEKEWIVRNAAIQAIEEIRS